MPYLLAADAVLLLHVLFVVFVVVGLLLILAGRLLRSKAGDTTYAGSFVSHWLEAILYYRAPAWVFAASYTAFAAIVVWSWVRVPPHRRHRHDRS